MSATHPSSAAPPWGSRAIRAGLAAWTLAALLILGQGIAEQLVESGRVTLDFLVRWRLFPVALWGAVTPAVLAAARRWPVRGGRWRVELAFHAGLLGAWMLLSNTLLRVPAMISGDTADLGREIVAAAVQYAPTGALLWTVLAVLGRGGRDRGPSATRAAAGPGTEPGLLSLRDGERTYLVERDAVRWVEADGDYLRVHTKERRYHIRGPLRGLERRLGNGSFLRIHRSTLVNAAFIREVQPRAHGDYLAVLRDGTELRIPRSRREVIRRLRGRAGSGPVPHRSP